MLPATDGRAAEPESSADAVRRREEWQRAGGGCVCEQCGLEYHDHPSDPADRWLTVLCDRTRVKL